MLDKLSKHIGDFYHREIPQQNAGLALNLTEQAIDRQIERLVSQFGGGASSQGDSPRQCSQHCPKQVELTSSPPPPHGVGTMLMLIGIFL